MKNLGKFQLEIRKYIHIGELIIISVAGISSRSLGKLNFDNCRESLIYKRENMLTLMSNLSQSWGEIIP